MLKMQNAELSNEYFEQAVCIVSKNYLKKVLMVKSWSKSTCFCKTTTSFHSPDAILESTGKTCGQWQENQNKSKQQQAIRMSKKSEKKAPPQRTFLNLIILSQKKEQQEEPLASSRTQHKSSQIGRQSRKDYRIYINKRYFRGHMIQAHKPQILYEYNEVTLYSCSFKNPVMQFPVKQMTNTKPERGRAFCLHQAKLASEINFHKTSEAKCSSRFKTRWDISANYICKSFLIL